MPRARFFLFFFFMLNVYRLQAQHGQVLKIWEDSSRQQTAPSALAHYYKGDFSPLPKGYLNPGFTNSVFWIALTVDQKPEDDLLLIADNAHINQLEWYAVTDSTILPLYVTGDFYLFTQRPITC